MLSSIKSATSDHVHTAPPASSCRLPVSVSCHTCCRAQVKLELLPEEIPLKVASQILFVGKAQRLLAQRWHHEKQAGDNSRPRQVLYSL